MAFIRSFGNPGIASAAQGISSAIVTQQQQQDQQLSRVMAMRELQMRQDQMDLDLDKFAAYKEDQQTSRELQRVQLGLSERQVNINEQDLSFRQNQQKLAVEKEQKRGNALIAFMKAASDMSITDAEWEEIASMEGMGAEFMMNMYQSMMSYRQKAANARQEQDAQFTMWSAQRLLDSGFVTEDQLANAQAESVAAGDPGHFSRWVSDRSNERAKRLGQIKAYQDRARQLESMLDTPGSLSTMSAAQRAQTMNALARVGEMIDGLMSGGVQPEAVDMEMKNIQRMSYSEEDRKALESFEANRDAQAMLPPAEVLDGLSPAKRSEYLSRNAALMGALDSEYGPSVQRAMQTKLKSHTEQMRTWGLTVDPENPISANDVPAPLFRFAFESLAAIDRMSIADSVRKEMQHHVIRSAGIKPDEAFFGKYVAWLQNDENLLAEMSKQYSYADRKEWIKETRESVSEQRKASMDARIEAGKRYALDVVNGEAVELTPQEREYLMPGFAQWMSDYEAGKIMNLGNNGEFNHWNSSSSPK